MKKVYIFIVVLVLVLLLGSLFLFSLDIKGTENTVPSDYVRIDALRFCETASTSSANRQKIKICGSIVSEKQDIPIRLYIYAMPEGALVAENNIDDRFSSGEFVRELDLSSGNNYGSYRVVAYFYKKIVGEVQFEISGP